MRVLFAGVWCDARVCLMLCVVGCWLVCVVCCALCDALSVVCSLLRCALAVARCVRLDCCVSVFVGCCVLFVAW